MGFAQARFGGLTTITLLSLVTPPIASTQQRTRWLDGLLDGQWRPRRTAPSATAGRNGLLTLCAKCVANVASQVSRFMRRNRECAMCSCSSEHRVRCG